MFPVTVHRLLTERKHIALLGAAAALAFPAAASAAQQGHQNHNHKLPPRQRLRADEPAAAGSPSHATGAIGIGDAQALSGPLLDPVERYSRLIATTAARAEHQHKVKVRKHHEAKLAREEEE